MSLRYKTPDLRGNLQNASTKVSLYNVFVVVDDPVPLGALYLYPLSTLDFSCTWRIPYWYDIIESVSIPNRTLTPSIRENDFLVYQLNSL
jgi:hypothetical protein